MSRWWSMHSHSRKSKDDALSTPTDLVVRAAELEMPALSLNDHGTLGGVAELYTAGKKHGVKPAPGVELYVVTDHAAGQRSAMHLTVTSYTSAGYRNLVGMNNLAQKTWAWRNARLDFAQLAQLAEDGLTEGLAIGTGCRSGPVVKALTERGPEAAEQVVNALAGWFPRTYVELMDHGFTAEGMWDHEIVRELVAIADRQGLPYVITSDTHYVHEHERVLHDALKTMVVAHVEEVDDRTFSGEGYWLVDEAHLEEIYAPKVLDTALDNLAEFASKIDVTIPELDAFSLKIPDVTFTGRQMETLKERGAESLVAWLDEVDASKKLRKEATDRFEAEIAVVETSGFAGYLLLVAWITDLCAERGIWFYTRGSATGSFLLFLLKITQENPLPSFHDIRFDRFLSPDRTSPPDVDLDIEHHRRDEIVAELEKRYPVLQVGTTMTYGITQDEDDEGNSKGSLAVKYYAVQRQLATGVNSWAEIPDEDKAVLKDLAERNLVAGRGAHPGGYIVAADEAAVAFMPLEVIGSSRTVVTAFDKGEVEKMGLPKIDLLGSRVLTALRICCNLITGGDNDKARAYYLDIPMEDKEVLKRCADGNTVGLFQLGGWTNRKVCQEINPKKVKDLIAVQALARPAPLQSGFTKSFMRRRDKVEAVPEMHEHIMAETKETYGLAIYQEQLVGVLRRLGLDAERLTKLLKAVKASGKQHALEAAKVMESELGPLIELAVSQGWSEADVAWLTSCLHDYGAGYSFGKAHSVQYGVTGYRTGYLAQHEPLAYWTGMLIAYDGVKEIRPPKEEVNLKFKAQARRDGVRVLPPHVNSSGVTFAPDPDAFSIREGLGSIPFVGAEACASIIAERPYISVIDLAKRVSTKVTGARDVLFESDIDTAVLVHEGEHAGEHRKTVLAQLHKAGALAGLEHGEPMRRARQRLKKCPECKAGTFGSPLDLEDHADAEHPGWEQRAAEAKAARAAARAAKEAADDEQGQTVDGAG